jgi:Domain of unknown function (DUF6378)
MSKPLLTQAHDIIHGDREKDYGHPKDNFQRIADRWRQHPKVSNDITAEDVTVMMADVKMARAMNTPTFDTMLDIAGYMGCWDRIQSKDDLPTP